MKNLSSLLIGLVLVGVGACGGDDGGGVTIDAPPVATTINISGTAKEVGAGGSTPLAGVLVAAYRNTDETTPVAMGTTDAQGNYTLVVTSDGTALDGYLKATIATYKDTYLYPPAPISADFAGASINMVKPGIYMLLAETLCQGGPSDGKGAIAVIVQDGSAAAVAGATVSSTPAATKYCYNGAGANPTPSAAATATAADGIGYMLYPTGDATVSATKTGMTFKSHAVKARAGALTTTLITP